MANDAAHNRDDTLKLDEQTAALFQDKGFVAEKIVNRGAYGYVYRGIYQRTNMPVAIKVVYLERVAVKIKSKFLPCEIVALMQVSHPHIVYVLDIMQADGKLFIIMEYANNGDLTGYIKKNGAISEPQTATWIAQVGNALHYLHIEQRLAHRDIKLDNVLLFDAVAKLSDFGFANVKWDWKRNEPIPSETFCGTTPYYCPQVLKGKPYNSYAADCYALGIMLFAMLNDRYPFHHQSSKIHYKEMTDPGFLRTRYIKQFSPDLLDLQTGLLTVDEELRMKITQVMVHPWIKRGGLPRPN